MEAARLRCEDLGQLIEPESEGFRPENLAAVRLGVASHNLFSLAYGLVLAARAQACRLLQMETRLP